MLDPILEIDAVRRPQVGLCFVNHDVGTEPLIPKGVTVGIDAIDGGSPSIAEDLVAGLATGRWRALLIVAPGRPGGPFRVQLRAENRSVEGAERLIPVGPSTARSTAPAAEMVRAIQAAGQTAEASSDIGHDAAGALFYRVLSGMAEHCDAPPVGLLRTPVDAGRTEVEAAVGAAASAVARTLSLLSRQLG